MKKIQEEISKLGLDGWLIFDFCGRNPFLWHLLGKEKPFTTRRSALFIPASGTPFIVLHKVEEHLAKLFTGPVNLYSSFKEWEEIWDRIVLAHKKIALDVSLDGSNLYTSFVDAGTYLFFQKKGFSIFSSALLVQKVFARLPHDLFQLHSLAAQKLMLCLKNFAEFLKNSPPNTAFSEKELQNILIESMKKEGLYFDEPPIVAEGKNAAFPHHIPGNASIQRGSLILVDLWAKTSPHGIYADFCQMFVWGREPEKEENHLFSLLVNARETALETIREHLLKKNFPQGSAVDRAARSVIEKAGYGAYFTHRLGHNIGEQDHGWGCHLDSLEMQEERPLESGLLFSIEPGIYIPGKIGLRTEINGWIDEKNTLHITGPLENHITHIA